MILQLITTNGEKHYIDGVDEKVFRELQLFAVSEGISLGQAITRAMREFLKKPNPKFY